MAKSDNFRQVAREMKLVSFPELIYIFEYSCNKNNEESRTWYKDGAQRTGGFGQVEQLLLLSPLRQIWNLNKEL